MTAADELGAVHFIGVGGAGMSGIARILIARGTPVSGSDVKDSRTLAALRAIGARIYVGHDASQLNGADTVVVSTAIRPSNVELTEAQRRGLLVLPRAAALAAVMAGGGHRGGRDRWQDHDDIDAHGGSAACRRRSVVCHWWRSQRIRCECPPRKRRSVRRRGRRERGSFYSCRRMQHRHHVEADHLDHYGTAEAVDEAFSAFVDCVDDDGFLVVGVDDDGGRRLAAVARSRGVDVRAYGEARMRTSGSLISRSADQRRRSPSSRAMVEQPVTLRIPGLHNVLNAAGAYAMLSGLGVDEDVAAEGLASFSGTRRRFELKGVASDIRVFDDYAHHPTKLRATLTAARTVADGGRVIVAFQPHRYSRTAAFRLELADALGLADEVVVMEVYSAGEDPSRRATGATVAAGVPLPRIVSSSSRPGHRSPGVLRLGLVGRHHSHPGAGDVTMLARNPAASRSGRFSMSRVLTRNARTCQRSSASLLVRELGAGVPRLG